MAVFAGDGVWAVMCCWMALNDGGVIGIGAECVLWGVLVGVFDHLKQGVRLLFVIDGPSGIEYFVSAVLRVGLCEHHQFDIGWDTV